MKLFEREAACELLHLPILRTSASLVAEADISTSRLREQEQSPYYRQHKREIKDITQLRLYCC